MKKNRMRRAVEPQEVPWYLTDAAVFVISGGTIFACFFAVLRYMWKSIWRSEVVFMYGWVLIFSVMLIIVISELSIIFTFLSLRNGDSRW